MSKCIRFSNKISLDYRRGLEEWQTYNYTCNSYTNCWITHWHTHTQTVKVDNEERFEPTTSGNGISYSFSKPLHGLEKAKEQTGRQADRQGRREGERKEGRRVGKTEEGRKRGRKRRKRNEVNSLVYTKHIMYTEQYLVRQPSMDTYNYTCFYSTSEAELSRVGLPFYNVLILDHSPQVTN